MENKQGRAGAGASISFGFSFFTSDSLIISSLSGQSVPIIFKANNGATKGDNWKLNFATGGVLTIGNDINALGTFVNCLKLTPATGATQINSLIEIMGKLKQYGTLTIVNGTALSFGTGGDLSFDWDITPGHLNITALSSKPVAIILKANNGGMLQTRYCMGV